MATNIILQNSLNPDIIYSPKIFIHENISRYYSIYSLGYNSVHEKILLPRSIFHFSCCTEASKPRISGKLSIHLQTYPFFWPGAINWYENRILNPESPADSIFAIIDLGYVYMLMEEDSLKSQFVGRLPEYRPAGKASYNKNKDYLLSLLPFNKSAFFKPDYNFSKTGGSLSQNIPNPSNGKTSISFNLKREAETILVLSDLSGKEIKRLNLGQKPSGNHEAEWQLEPIASGLYIYSLILDGVISDVKKMSVIK